MAERRKSIYYYCNVCVGIYRTKRGALRRHSGSRLIYNVDHKFRVPRVDVDVGVAVVGGEQVAPRYYYLCKPWSFDGFDKRFNYFYFGKIYVKIFDTSGTGVTACVYVFMLV